jgi:GNAT superfamily N-acetyltransferase
VDQRQTSVRGAEPSDASALAMLLRDIASENLVDIRIEIPERELAPSEAELLLQLVRSMCGEILLLADEAEVAGFVILTPAEGAGHRMGFAIAIRADRRGRGAGRRLLQGAIDWARGIRIAALDLRVRAANAPAMRLYASLGFEPSAREGIETHPDWLRMTLAIESGPSPGRSSG